MLSLDGDSDDDLDKYVPSIIPKPKEEGSKTPKSKYKGGKLYSYHISLPCA